LRRGLKVESAIITVLRMPPSRGRKRREAGMTYTEESLKADVTILAKVNYRWVVKGVEGAVARLVS
jgi:hypothetical protein